MITIRNLTKSHNTQEVLRDISLEITKGEIVSIIGESGTGKSTLLRCMNLLEIAEKGWMQIDSHEIRMDHFDKKQLYAIRRSTAMIFQQSNLFRNKNALDNIALPLRVTKKISKEQAEDIAAMELGRVGLSHKKNSMPHQLSGGEQQRVGIARAIALDPAVLLFDEPTSALDPSLVGEVLEVIAELSEKHNKTMVIVSHEMAFCEQISDRTIFMHDGKIVESAHPSVLFHSPKKVQTIEFLSKSIYHGNRKGDMNGKKKSGKSTNDNVGFRETGCRY